MEGVYVRGVKKPYGCTFCPWCQTFYCFCKAANKTISVLEMNKGPEWCPLVEVPDHGDLIDRDLLINNVYADVCEDRGGYAIFGYSTKQILAQPAVISANKEEGK